MKGIRKSGVFKYRMGGVFTALMLMLCAACSGLLSADDDKEKQSILVALPGSFRSAQAGDATRYEVTFSMSGAKFTVQGVPGGYITSGELPVGIYTVTVTAYDTSGTAIGRGEQAAVVTRGNIAYVTVNMTALPSIYDYVRVSTYSELVSALEHADGTAQILLTADITLGGNLGINKSAVIEGAGHTIDGGYSDYSRYNTGGYHIASSAGDITVNNVTFTNCYADNDDNGFTGGGAIAKIGGSLTLHGCTFANNIAYQSEGGALALSETQVAITGCTFVNTDSSSFMSEPSRFIFVAGGSVAVSGSTFAGGKASEGGALYIGGGASVSMSGCTVKDCNAYHAGGGVYIDSGSLSCTGCTFSGNTVGFDYPGQPAGGSLDAGTANDIYYIDGSGTFTQTNSSIANIAHGSGLE